MPRAFAARNFAIEGITNPSGFGDLGQLISVLLQAAIIVSGLGALAFLIMGGIQFLTSGGDKAGTEAARGRITYAIIGLTIIVGSYALIRIVETVFGVSVVSGICWPGPSGSSEFENCVCRCITQTGWSRDLCEISIDCRGLPR